MAVIKKTIVWILIITHVNLIVGYSMPIDQKKKTDKTEDRKDEAEAKSPVEKSDKKEKPAKERSEFKPLHHASIKHLKFKKDDGKKLKQIKKKDDIKKRHVTKAEINVNLDREEVSLKSIVESAPINIARPAQPVSESQDITDLIQIDIINSQFNQSTKIFSFDVTLTNISQETIIPSIKAIIENLRPGPLAIKVSNADNGLSGNGAYWDYSDYSVRKKNSLPVIPALPEIGSFIIPIW